MLSKKCKDNFVKNEFLNYDLRNLSNKLIQSNIFDANHNFGRD